MVYNSTDFTTAPKKSKNENFYVVDFVQTYGNINKLKFRLSPISGWFQALYQGICYECIHIPLDKKEIYVVWINYFAG